MTQAKIDSSLATLESSKRRFGEGETVIRKTLRALSGSQFRDAESLIRLHESLLFFRAYPPSARILEQVEHLLKSIPDRISQLPEGADLSPLDDPEVSGIAGTEVTSNFSFVIVRWLTEKYSKQVLIDWDWFEEEDRFGAATSRFMPLLAEEAMVEAHVPYRDWLHAAKGRRRELVWLIERFESLGISDRAKAELYDALKLHITWKFGHRVSRTEMKLPVRTTFFHDRPLIQRRDISLTKELNSSPIPIVRLSRAAGEKLIDLARETSAVRYRELHGFTYGDPQHVFKADLGRGTEVFMMGVQPENRLPLRAYHAALIFKNGVPVGYFEGLSIFERMESGFNLYYTFRDGETAWLYARILRLMRQLLGVTVFSLDPYQIGHENEEGIQSGAFWFYRKLGFRPVRSDLLKLMMLEEKKLAANSQYRTPAATLRKLAAGYMIFELPGFRSGVAWDRFQIRNIGLAIQRRMARDFDSDPERIRSSSAKLIDREFDLDRLDANEFSAAEGLVLVLAAIPGVGNWSDDEKKLAARIIKAKAGREEALYLKLMQKHLPLRIAISELGS
jgi:hypothetical protein